MTLVGLGAVATGVTSWAITSHSTTATAPESKAAQGHKAQEAATLLQAGNLQVQYRDYVGATRTFRRVLELDPHNKVAWYDLGVVAQQEGRAGDARKAYDEALKIDPRYASALYNKAVLLKPSDPGQAVGLLRRAIAATPRAATAHLQLGLILAQKDRDDEAEEEFGRAVAADPSLHSAVPEEFRDRVSPTPTSSQAGATR
ncbi:tetratricopeptide repeat protein [Streptomyces sp. NPDC088337]|uniref:tetratricopeptide repeat protein n=1 Tax=unclassified Streptomyces TaxID=2593676 RepID=UPI002DDB9701|nr:tetratricopeptide repeat protein [Streptomyces sp. NBC_01788]WSB28443.1 tetratricopeptide repeat protein [Streptomyces sp. NBC_01788]